MTTGAKPMALQFSPRQGVYLAFYTLRMPVPRRIHILGASGSGTSTLGRDLATHLSCLHVDTDDVYWVPSDPPYTVKRTPDHRLEILRETLRGPGPWVLSGSLSGWGDPLIPWFDAVVFVTVPVVLRLERLVQRERARHGAQIDGGGQLHALHREFVAWAAGYDDPEPGVGRSRVRHEAWLAGLTVPVIRVENTGTREDMLERVVSQLR